MTGKLVHVRMEYGEALESKRDLLLLEMSILKTIKMLKKYKEFRMNELKLKAKMGRKIKETVMDIKRIEKSLPKVKISPSVKREIEHPHHKTEKTRVNYDMGLEQELKDIQRKLNSLQNR